MGKTNQYADLQNTMAAVIWARANRHYPSRKIGAPPRGAKDAAADLIALYEDANGGPVDGSIHDLYRRYFEVAHHEKARPKGAALDKVFEHFAHLLVVEAEGERQHDAAFDGVINVPMFEVSSDGSSIEWSGDSSQFRHRASLPRRRRNPTIPSEAEYLGETLGAPNPAHPHEGGPCPECGARTRLRYPGNDPENGPARLYCTAGHAPCYACGEWFQAKQQGYESDVCPKCEGQPDELVGNPDKVNRSISTFASGIEAIGKDGVEMLWRAIGVATKDGMPVGTFKKVVNSTTIAVVLPDGKVQNYPADQVYPYEIQRRNPSETWWRVLWSDEPTTLIRAGLFVLKEFGVNGRFIDNKYLAVPGTRERALEINHALKQWSYEGKFDDHVSTRSVREIRANPPAAWRREELGKGYRAPDQAGDVGNLRTVVYPKGGTYADEMRGSMTRLIEHGDPFQGRNNVKHQLITRGQGKPPWLPNPSDPHAGHPTVVAARRAVLGKFRVPTIEEIAKAFAYVDAEYGLPANGTIDGEQWAEGLAFIASHPERKYIDPEDLAVAREVFPQLPEDVWREIAARADHLLKTEGERPRFTV